MTPSRQLLGQSQTPVLIVDDVGPSVGEIVEWACLLSPFPPAMNNYPGVRRVLGAQDSNAWVYVIELLEMAKPYIAGAFDIDGFDLVEASFSMVTTPPSQLGAVQRIPHFDSVDADLIALLHYGADCPGTAFYRHRRSGLEIVTADTVNQYVAAARECAAHAPADYIRQSNEDFEQIGRVSGVARRLVAYPGRLLHSGIIPAGFVGSTDPRRGRLTTNIFLKGWRNA